MVAPHQIAVIANRDGFDAQSLLAQAAADWRGDGCEVIGVLAEPRDTDDGGCSAGFLRDIVSGQRFAMQLDVPPAGTTCHLDAASVETACAQLLDQIAAGDIVLLSKFGKLESMQQGLWAAFSAAAAAGKPVLTTVSAKHVDAWKAFAPRATWLRADLRSVVHWWQSIKANGQPRLA